MERKSKFRELRKQIDPQTQNKWNAEQNFLKQKIIQKDSFTWTPDTLKYIAGVDISFSMQFEDVACSALIIYDMQQKKVIYEDYQYVRLDLPYVPGFLAFRELPALLHLFQRLKKTDIWPQVIFVDGNGIIHQNQCGLACHLGIVLDTPTVGCGKTFFYVDGMSKEGIFDACEEMLKNAGDYITLKGKSGRLWAAALKGSNTSNEPLFISVGHKISLETAVQCIEQTCHFRIPEPIRQADIRSRQKIKHLKAQEADKAQSYPMIYLKS